jgi:hypothetical protein
MSKIPGSQEEEMENGHHTGMKWNSLSWGPEAMYL